MFFLNYKKHLNSCADTILLGVLLYVGDSLLKISDLLFDDLEGLNKT